MSRPVLKCPNAAPQLGGLAFDGFCLAASARPGIASVWCRSPGRAAIGHVACMALHAVICGCLDARGVGQRRHRPGAIRGLDVRAGRLRPARSPQLVFGVFRLGPTRLAAAVRLGSAAMVMHWLPCSVALVVGDHLAQSASDCRQPCTRLLGASSTRWAWRSCSLLAVSSEFTSL